MKRHLTAYTNHIAPRAVNQRADEAHRFRGVGCARGGPPRGRPGSGAKPWVVLGRPPRRQAVLCDAHAAVL